MWWGEIREETGRKSQAQILCGRVRKYVNQRTGLVLATPEDGEVAVTPIFGSNREQNLLGMKVPWRQKTSLGMRRAMYKLDLVHAPAGYHLFWLRGWYFTFRGLGLEVTQTADKDTCVGIPVGRIVKFEDAKLEELRHHLAAVTAAYKLTHGVHTEIQPWF